MLNAKPCCQIIVADFEVYNNLFDQYNIMYNFFCLRQRLPLRVRERSKLKLRRNSMKTKLGLRILLTLITLVTIATFVMVLYSLTNSSKTNKGNGVISLEAPFFTSVAEASPAQEAKTFLEEEAGISAYGNIGQIDLTKAKEVYRTIEKETDEYIVGSVAISGYDETQDAHVYVSKDGWVVAYYSKDDPVGKMVDLQAYDKTGAIRTKLEIGLGIMCNQLGRALPNVKYYDFGSPDANKLMIIGEKKDGFELKIPDDIAVSKMSWWYYYRSYSDDGFYIDGSYIGREYYGKITPSQLSKGVSHDIRGYKYPLGIVLVYKEP
jgi:hypothetical protein